MNKAGPIVMIEDDMDDQDIFRDVFIDLAYKNEVLFFKDGELALEYLIKTKEKPFIVFSDINMPKLGGMELRAKIHENEDLRLKSIPYLFFSTSAEQENVIDAYSKSIQGFFVKPRNYNDIRETMKTIIEYWQKCVSPKYVK
ncbi:MAG: response regulator [Flavobacterium sp.]|uniref:response regulator n=1 Tax=Flavobacterium sp. TaxID=239 RepID=UPI003265CA53